MLNLSVRSALMALGAIVVPAAIACAQCGYVDFENLPANTPVSTQYPGVTFSARNSNGTVGTNPRIYVAAGTSSPTRALKPVGDGIDEFSCDYLRMDFAADQHLVTFSVGTLTGCSATDTCQIRAYNAAGALLTTQNVPVNGTLLNTCRTLVRVGSRTGPNNIHAIEVQYGVAPLCACAYELIDDVTYDTDTTPPIGLIASPVPFSCVCDSATFLGTSNDPDGTYLGDMLEYATDPAGPWTLIGTASSPAPGPSSFLYSWNTSALPSGYYFVRLTVNNTCGLDTVFVTVINVDNSPPSIVLRSPTSGAIVGGQVCFDGSVVDGCTLSSYTVRYRPAAGGTFNPVDPAHPTYSTPVVNDPFAFWQTASGGAAVADGTYTVEVSAVDSCTQSTLLSRNLVVDNTAPTAVITSPVNCSRVAHGLVQIIGTASDAHMGGWVVQYTGGDAHGWVTIASGNTNVVSGLLATWDARTLRSCCYALRLIVTDSANVSCTGSGNSREYTVAFDLGTVCTQDYNGDGLVNSQDFFDFLNIFFNGCP
jgi:hypothetical protein